MNSEEYMEMLDDLCAKFMQKAIKKMNAAQDLETKHMELMLGTLVKLYASNIIFRMEEDDQRTASNSLADTLIAIITPLVDKDVMTRIVEGNRTHWEEFDNLSKELQDNG